MRSAVTGWTVSSITTFKTSAEAHSDSHKMIDGMAKCVGRRMVANPEIKLPAIYCLSTRAGKHEFPGRPQVYQGEFPPGTPLVGWPSPAGGRTSKGARESQTRKLVAQHVFLF